MKLLRISFSIGCIFCGVYLLWQKEWPVGITSLVVGFGLLTKVYYI